MRCVPWAPHLHRLSRELPMACTPSVFHSEQVLKDVHLLSTEAVECEWLGAPTPQAPPPTN